MNNDTMLREIRRTLDPDIDDIAGLRSLARSVYLDRNAQGMPKRDRMKIKAKARPDLRKAIRHARKSRDALLAGDVAMFECERDRARLHVALARLQFFEPYVDQVAKRYADLARTAPAGGKSTAEKYARPKLDDLIRGCIGRGDRTRTYTKQWADDFGISVDAVERDIKRIKALLKKF
jgi:hypothetical protein